MDDYRSCSAMVDRETSTETVQSVKYRNVRAYTSYFLFGLCNNFGYVVMLTAAADIIKDQAAYKGYAVSLHL